MNENDVNLLNLSTGRCSLEVPLVQWPKILNLIENSYGKPSKIDHINYSIFTFSDHDFLMESDWDEVCLISTETEGDLVLLNLMESFRKQDAAVYVNKPQ
jgi:hypothetical protein